jgi:hypothetical protein
VKNDRQALAANDTCCKSNPVGPLDRNDNLNINQIKLSYEENFFEHVKFVIWEFVCPW